MKSLLFAFITIAILFSLKTNAAELYSFNRDLRHPISFSSSDTTYPMPNTTPPGLPNYQYNMPNPYNNGNRGFQPGIRGFRMPYSDTTFRINPRSFNPRREQLGLRIQDTENNSGVKVLSVTNGSKAEKAGLKEGDIIQKIDGQKVEDVGSALSKVRKNRDKDYEFQILRDKKEMTITIKNQKLLSEADL